MSDLISMDKMPAPYKDLLAQLQPETAFGGENFSTSRRISLRSNIFRKVVNGKTAPLRVGHPILIQPHLLLMYSLLIENLLVALTANKILKGQGKERVKPAVYNNA